MSTTGHPVLYARIANYEYEINKMTQGAFGSVHRGRNVKNGQEVVVKTEPRDVAVSSLKHETTILNILYSKSCRNIPPTYWYGISKDGVQRLLVMPFYRESLASLANNITPAMLNNVMRSAVSILKQIHSHYVVHRDIKPANWMINDDELVLIDFGLATFYVDGEEKHIPNVSTPKPHIIGTPKYASVHVHRGEEYGRRDDLLSILYVGLFLLEGGVLWKLDVSGELGNGTGLDLDNASIDHPRNRWFLHKKVLTQILAQIGDRSPPLAEFAKNVYELSFHERPEYDRYAELFARQNHIKVLH